MEISRPFIQFFFQEMRTLQKKTFLQFGPALFLIFSSCSQSVEKPPNLQSEIIGLASPITLQMGETKIILADFFSHPLEIDSVTANPLTAKISEDKTILYLNDNGQKIPTLSELKVWIKNNPYSILLKKQKKIHYQFLFAEHNKKFKSVSIAGEFNSWDPQKNVLVNEMDIWKTELTLDAGNYQYQMVLDGKWMLDIQNPDSINNGSGGYNSLMKIREGGVGLAPQIFTLPGHRDDSQTLFIGTKNNPEKIFAFWQNTLLNQHEVQGTRGDWEIKIPENAFLSPHSFIRVFGYNKFGTGNDLLIPLENGKIVSSAAGLSKKDKCSMIMYFVLTDRFFNGDSANDSPVKDIEVDIKANYQGGDLRGITKKIKDGYFSKLGINAIWISPIIQNPLTAFVEFPAPHRKYSGYHGYWPVSFKNIDSRFGNEQDFEELIKTAHENGIRVLLDFVSNHVHNEHPIFKAHPGWFTKIDLPDGRKNIRLWDEYRLTTWFDTFLPDLDYSKQEVVDAITDSAMFWVNKFNLDGFRHDATKHVPEEFWRGLTKKIKNHSPENSFFQIGETFGSRELIGSYVNSGMQDAQFDFNLYFDARSVFSLEKESFQRLANSLQSSLDYYGYHSMMGNITGNHDLPRFITLASGSLKLNEDEKEAGWKREIENGNEKGYKNLSSLIAFMTTIPGIPVIYYGDEIGMPGAGDPDNRRMMKFEKLSPAEETEKKMVERLTGLRKENISLIYGDYQTLKIENDFFAYARTYFDEITIVVFNKNPKTKNNSFAIPERFAGNPLKGNFGSKWYLKNTELSLEMDGFSFEILTYNNSSGKQKKG